MHIDRADFGDGACRLSIAASPGTDDTKRTESTPLPPRFVSDGAVWPLCHAANAPRLQGLAPPRPPA
jgi:hypothetical protein